MSAAAHIKPTHKAIQTYYETLKAYGEHYVEHETALRSAFQNLLDTVAKSQHWILVPEAPYRVGGKTLRPDGTLRDEYKLPRGYWEAKDTSDDLDTEIQKKIATGYPLTNTIFEETRQAVLIWGTRACMILDCGENQRETNSKRHDQP